MFAVESATYNSAAMAEATRSGIQDASMQTRLASQAAFQDAVPLMPFSVRNDADRDLARSIRQSAWLTRAEEFRDDLAPGTILSAGEPHNNGLVRMITGGQYMELMTGMNDFVLDLPTQVAVLRLLQQHLDIPNQPEQSAANAVEASRHNMHTRIAQSMRCHAQDLQLPLLGVEVMSLLKSDGCYSHASILYIVATLIHVLKRHPQDARLHVDCFRITQSITAHSTTPWIMVDGQNMFTVIVQSLQLHPGDHMLALVCTQLLHRFVTFIRTQRDKEQMLICGIAGVEDVLCTALTSHLLEAKVAMHGLAACRCLHKLFSMRMRQLHRLIDLAANALSIHASTGYVTPYAVGVLFCTLKPASFTRRTPAARFKCLGALMFPILLGAMRALRGHSHMTFVSKKIVCTEVFQILYISCVNNHENVAAAISCGIVEFLMQAFQGLVLTERIDMQWHLHRSRLEQSLLSAQMP